MPQIQFYIVDVFASNKYEGNQLAVFVDEANQVSDGQMQQHCEGDKLRRNHLH